MMPAASSLQNPTYPRLVRPSEAADMPLKALTPEEVAAVQKLLRGMAVMTMLGRGVFYMAAFIAGLITAAAGVVAIIGTIHHWRGTMP